MTAPRAEIVVHVDEIGRGTLKLNGIDLSSFASGFTIVSKAGERTRITIDVHAFYLTGSVFTDLKNAGFNVERQEVSRDAEQAS